MPENRWPPLELPRVIEAGGRSHRLTHPLGTGGCGDVYACEHEDGIVVAAKRFGPGHPATRDPGSFLNELLSMAARQKFGGEGPYLVRYMGFFVADDEPWLETERCDGDLQSCLGLEGCDGREWFRPVAVALLHGLEELHLDGDVHGDLQAKNVFYMGNPEAGPEHLQFKLGDYGYRSNWLIRDETYPEEDTPPVAREIANAACLLLQVWCRLDETPYLVDETLRLVERLPAELQAPMRAALEERFRNGLTADSDFLYALFPDLRPAR